MACYGLERAPQILLVGCAQSRPTGLGHQPLTVAFDGVYATTRRSLSYSKGPQHRKGVIDPDESINGTWPALDMVPY